MLVDEVIDPKKRPNRVKKGNAKSSSLLATSSLHHQSLGNHSPSNPSNATINGSIVNTSHSEFASKNQAQRFALLHLLAVRPLSVQTASDQTKISKGEVSQIFDTVAERSENHSELQLIPRRFKELDVWRFPYASSKDRAAAIENAVRAFDRLRLSPSDPLWQRLLPKEERNKGKTLSRLPGHRELLGSRLNNQSKSTHNSPDPAKANIMARRLVNGKGKPVRPRADPKPKPKKEAKVHPKPLSDEYVHESDDDDILRNNEPAKSESKMKVHPMGAAGAGNVLKRAAPEASDGEKVGVVAGRQATSQPKKRVKISGNGPQSKSLVTQKATEPGSIPAKSKVSLLNAKLEASSQKLKRVENSSAPSNNLRKGKNDFARPAKPASNLNSPAQGSAAASKPKPRPANSTTPSSSSKIIHKKHIGSNPFQEPKTDGVKLQTKPTTGNPQRVRIIEHSKAKQFLERPASRMSASPSELSDRGCQIPVAAGGKRAAEDQAEGKDKTAQPAKKKSKSTEDSQRSSSPLSSLPSNLSASLEPDAKISSPSESEGQPKSEGGALLHRSDEHAEPSSASKSEKYDITDSPTRSASGTLLSIPVEEIRKRRQKALYDYLQARVDIGKISSDAMTTEEAQVLSEKHKCYKELMEDKTEGGEIVLAQQSDLLTPSMMFPEGASDYFHRSLAPLVPEYNELYAAVNPDSNPCESQPEIKRLRALHSEFEELKKFHRAAAIYEGIELDKKLAADPPGDGISSTPPTRRQLLHLYAEYYEKYHALVAFQNESKKHPEYPFIPEERAQQDRSMYIRLCQRRKELLEGFPTLIHEYNIPWKGEVTANLEEPVLDFRDAETLIWKLKAHALQWKDRHNKIFSKLGDTKPEEMNEHWDELKIYKDWERTILRSNALDFGHLDKGRYEDVELDTDLKFDLYWFKFG